MPDICPALTRNGQHSYDDQGLCFECDKPRLETVKVNTTQTARNRRHREKSRKQGLTAVTVQVPVERRAELVAIATQMRESNEQITEVGKGA